MLTVFPPRPMPNRPFRAAGLGLYVDCEKAPFGWRYTVYRDYDSKLVVLHRQRFLSWEAAEHQFSMLREALSRIQNEDESPSPGSEASCAGLRSQIRTERRQREEWLQVLRDLREQMP